MQIVENLAQWRADYHNRWLPLYHDSGKFEWSSYPRPRNKTAPSGAAIDLSQSRLVLISSAGAYLRDSQQRYDDENDMGDYTIRVFPADTPFEALEIAHTHYNHTAVNSDPQVLLPVGHLRDLVAEGALGELASNIIGFSGYHTDLDCLVDELIPAIVAAAHAEKAAAALLVPA